MVAPTPAQAASTVLCTGYTSCADQGYPHAGYASAKSTSYWNMYTGTNCTNYAAYRLITTNGLPNKRPAAGVGNARDWGTAMASVTNSTPAVGAIAWWGKTGNHVAYIERVVSSSEIWVSESNWSGAFDWRKITKSGGGWPDGIIHFADTAGVPAAPKTLVSSSLPTITGTVRYGGTLTASGGAWSPAPSTLGYQWAVGGVDVAGATTTTFKPRPQDIGKPVTVRVRAAKSGYTATFATSSPTGAVAPAPMSASVRPAVIGTPKVGKRLTASTGTWSRTGLSFSYQWLSDGVAVAGATASVYPVRSLDANRVVTVQVTAQRAGYVTTTVSSAPTARVTPGTITSASRPTVSGNARVGSRLTASPGTFSPSADVSYQWYAEGKAIAGATERTLIPSYRQRDGRIKVKVTARKTGFSSLSATSAYTAPVRTGQIRSIGQPTIDGAAVVGTTLSVVPGTTTPAKVSARYQWLRDGKAISGGTGRTHRVSANDLGRRLSVRVTLKATGYAPRVVTTAPTRGVRSAARITATIARSAAGSLTVSVRVKASGIPAPRGTVTVRPATGPARAATIGNGRATITLTGLAPGAQVVRITFGGTSSIGPVTIQRTVTVT